MNKIKNHSDMFRIECDPSSGSRELYGTTARRTVNTNHWFKITLPNTDQAHDKHQWTTKISVKYSSILPDDGSHTIRNMLEWSL